MLILCQIFHAYSGQEHIDCWTDRSLYLTNTFSQIFNKQAHKINSLKDTYNKSGVHFALTPKCCVLRGKPEKMSLVWPRDWTYNVMHWWQACYNHYIIKLILNIISVLWTFSFDHLANVKNETCKNYPLLNLEACSNWTHLKNLSLSMYMPKSNAWLFGNEILHTNWCLT